MRRYNYLGYRPLFQSSAAVTAAPAKARLSRAQRRIPPRLANGVLTNQSEAHLLCALTGTRDELTAL